MGKNLQHCDCDVIKTAGHAQREERRVLVNNPPREPIRNSGDKSVSVGATKVEFVRRHERESLQVNQSRENPTGTMLLLSGVHLSSACGEPC